MENLPRGPGVYLFRDEGGHVLYVGKAKDLRRRLSSYRTAGRRKAYRKMRTIVREAASVEVRSVESERAALLTENALIQDLRPPYNIDGAYSFLYPAIGLREKGGQVLFCFTTTVEAWDGLEIEWFGSFRSRLRARDAFDALVDLAVRLGHREPRSRLPELPRVRGSRVVGVRRLGGRWLAQLRRFLAGESSDVLGGWSLALLEKAAARRDAGEVQEALARLRDFYESDIVRLRAACERAGRPPGFVAQAERDALFIRSRHPVRSPSVA